MPQLDKFSFVTQIFWLLVLFFFMYIVFLKWFLPTIYRSLRFRKKILGKFLAYGKNLSEEENLAFKLHKTLFFNRVVKYYEILKRFSTRVSSFKNVCKSFVLKNLVAGESNEALYLVNLKKYLLEI